MSRVPSDAAGCREAMTIAGRLAQVIRGQVLSAAQASLRAILETLAQVPKPRPEGPAETAAPSAVETPTGEPPRTIAGNGSHDAAGTSAAPPAAELLRAYTPLPQSYGSERLVLLARDPHCLFAYWDVSEARRKSVRQHAASDTLRTILRAYDVSQVAFDAGPPTRFQDFAVSGDARSVYAYVGKPAACFIAEIGYLRPDGAFFPLARSQPIWTPRTEQPGSAPRRWMTVGWSEESDAGALVPSEATRGPVGDASGTETVAAARRAPSSWLGPAPTAAQRGSWSLVRGGRNAGATDDTPPTASEP